MVADLGERGVGWPPDQHIRARQCGEGRRVLIVERRDGALLGPRASNEHLSPVRRGERHRQAGRIKSHPASLSLTGELAEARYNLAILLATGERPKLKEARRHYEKALELGLPKNPQLEEQLFR